MRWAMMTGAAALAAGCMMSASGAAQDVTESFSEAYQACITYGERNDAIAIPAAECNARELRRQDAWLNASYKAVMARLSPQRHAALRTDERNWIVARDRTCRSLPNKDQRTECVIDQTIKRTRHLRSYR